MTSLAMVTIGVPVVFLSPQGKDNDSLVDTPTNYGTDTGLGAECRGNYATLNPIFNPNGTIVTYANGNLDFSHSASGGNAPKMVVMSTMAIPLQGKWYWEYTVGSTVNDGVGISNELVVGGGARGSASAAYNDGGSFSGDYTNPASAGSFSAGNIIGMAYDQSAGTLAFYKSNVLQGTITNISTTVTFFPYREPGSSSTSGAGTFNFGQRPFAYTAPSGFKALCTQNLPDPTIVDGGEYFDVVTDTGANIKSASEAVYTHQWAWIKDMDNVNNHQLIDSVRGTSAVLQSNTTAAETTYSTPSGESVAWVWSAPNTGVSNTDGTITSTVSANTDSGFSIVTYTGTGANATVGHGLGVAPSMIIVKNRDDTDVWLVQHTSMGPTKYIILNRTDAEGTASTVWNDTAPTSTVFSIGTLTDVNTNTEDFVAYCFAAIPGYSAFGSYTGNGSTDGPFVYTGFRPAFVMVKNSSAAWNWIIWDSERNTYNQADNVLQPNNSDAEYISSSFMSIDILSNGFKLRTSDSQENGSGNTLIYAAFAENPFKYSLAR
jgi:hypothetical protein